MGNDPAGRVVVWLHLADREEVGDFLIREVWKTVELRASGVPDDCGKCVPLSHQDALELLSMPDKQLEQELFRRLGVTTRESYIGIPKGPYYDAVDVAKIRSTLKRTLFGSSGESKAT